MTRKHGIIILVIVMLFVAFIWSNPLRRPEQSIRNWLEKTTPLGSSLTEVRVTASQPGWYDARFQGNDGCSTDNYIRGELGEYQGLPFITSVSVFWEFDENDQLANIRIWKNRDGS